VTSFHDLLASLHGKSIISVIPTLDEYDNVEELQFQFTDGTHLVVQGETMTLDGDSEGCLRVTTDLARRWWS
jgi:hypothetical protein